MVARLTRMSPRAITRTDVATELKAEIGRKFNNNVSEFARAVGVNRSQMDRYLSGDRDPGTDRLMEWLFALQVSPEDFFASVRRQVDEESGAE